MVAIRAKLRPKSLYKVTKNLNELIAKVERQGKRDALRKAGRPMIKAIKANAPVDSGNLRRSIKSKIRTSKKDEQVILTIGPDRNTKGTKDGKTVRAVKYANIVEFGSIHRSGTRFMTKAFMSTKMICFDIYHREVKAFIKKAGKKLSKTAKI